MTEVAFIGLGVMGSPMAVNLVAAGHRVSGFTRTGSRTAALVAKGGRAAESIADAVRDADAIFTMLPDGPDVEGVVLGKGGVLESAREGALLIDTSTVSPRTAREIAASARERGLRPIDAPVSGGESAAVSGTLSIMVGGAADDVELARPLLEAVGGTIVHVGPSGAGQTVKAANQLVVAGTIELVAEALVLLDALGIDLSAAVEALSGGLAGSAVLDRKAPGMLSRSFTPGFRVDLHHKDLGIVTETARAAGVAIPLGAHVAGLMASLRAQGGGALDHSALLLQVERLSGRRTDAEER